MAQQLKESSNFRHELQTQNSYKIDRNIILERYILAAYV